MAIICPTTTFPHPSLPPSSFTLIMHHYCPYHPLNHPLSLSLPLPSTTSYLKGAPPNVLVACKGSCKASGLGLAQGQGLGPLSALRVTDAVDGIRSGHSEGSGGDGGGGGATMLFDYWSSIRPTNNSNTISNNTTTTNTTNSNNNNSATSTATDETTHGPLSAYLSPHLHIIYPQAESSFQLGSNLKDWGNTNFPTVINNLPTLEPTHLTFQTSCQRYIIQPTVSRLYWCSR